LAHDVSLLIDTALLGLDAVLLTVAAEEFITLPAATTIFHDGLVLIGVHTSAWF
jgi:hypothetical protein